MELKQIGIKTSGDLAHHFLKIEHPTGECTTLLRNSIPAPVKVAKANLLSMISQIGFGKSSERNLSITMLTIKESKDGGYDLAIEFTNTIGGFSFDGKVKRLHLKKIDEKDVNQMYHHALHNAKSGSEQLDREKQADLMWCKMQAYELLLELFDETDAHLYEIIQTKNNQAAISFEVVQPRGVRA